MSEVEGSENTYRNEGFLYIQTPDFVMWTFGVYCFYWQYRNWAYVKEREELPSDLFGGYGSWLFFVYALLKEIRKDSYYHQAAQPSFSPLLLTIGAIFRVNFAVD